MAARLAIALALALLVAVPPLLPKYALEVLISILFFGYLGACWNILGGYGGQFSFGHAAFFGIGAYTSTLLFLQLGLTPWLGMVAGGALAAAFGLFAGYLSFRYGLRGPYFSLVTLAFAEMLRLVVMNWNSVTNGTLGLVVSGKPFVWWPGAGVVYWGTHEHSVTHQSGCSRPALGSLENGYWL